MAEKIVVDIEFQTNVSKISKDLESVKDALADTNENLEDIAKTGKSTDGALGKVGKGFKGVGLAMKTLGVGLIIEAFKFLKDVLMQNQAVIDAVAIVSETLGVIMQQVSGVISDVVDAVSNSAEGFEGLGKVMDGIVTTVLFPFKAAFYGIQLGLQEVALAWEQSFFGGKDQETIDNLNAKILESKANLSEVVDEVVEAGQSIKDNLGEALTEIGSVVSAAVDTAVEGVKDISISGALEMGKALAEAKKNEELLEVLRAKQQLQGQLDAELQRQIRDDVRKTFEERIAANDELARILENQVAKEKVSIDEKVKIAQLQLSLDESNVKSQVKLEEALLAQLELKERIAGQTSEQLTNQAALEKELFDAQNEIQLATMTAREQELLALEQDYLAKAELARKAGEDDVAITEQYNALVQESNDKFADEDLKTFEELAKAKEDARKNEIQMLSNTIKMAGDLFEEGTAASKVSGVATATINTWTGVTEALKLPPPFSYIQAGLTLAAGLKSVKNIMAVKTEIPTPETDTGNINLPSGGVDTQSITDLSNIPSITEQFNNQFVQDTPPIQAFVVEQQVTNSQQINTLIQQKATL